MQYTKTTIGSVDISTPKRKSIGSYSDGETEDALLELFSRADDVEKSRQRILDNNPSWAMYYHLNKRRANLLRWYEFPKGSSVLEVGAGCGGITEELIRNPVNVTALELSEKRALINAHRNKKADNLEVFIGNLEDYSPKEKFGYVVCVGVLEYAGTFIHTKNPYEDFVKIIAKLLKPGGTFLLAIENRFGLKYWAGAKEDHVHEFFTGHNGYPSRNRVQTFGKEELSDLLKGNGFKETKFYYPFPDYKNPSFVYSDDLHPGRGMQFPLGSLPTPTLDRPREHFFSEQSTMRYVEKNGLFPHFSNSFLVEAKK